MAKTMDLTDSEAALIEEMRVKDAEDRKRKLHVLEVLRTAFEYENWLQKNGMGSTYSTFCDDFGYGAAKWTFEDVERVRKFVRELPDRP